MPLDWGKVDRSERGGTKRSSRSRAEHRDLGFIRLRQGCGNGQTATWEASAVVGVLATLNDKKTRIK